MKKLCCGLFSLWVCFFFIACATQSNQTINRDDYGIHFIEKKAGFSIYAPKEWETMDVGLKYMSLIGPQEDDFHPNIGFFDEQFTGELSEYIDAALLLFPNIYADFILIERIFFGTNSGKQGELITIGGRINEIHVRQRYYVFSNRRNTAVTGIIGTAAFDSGIKYDSIFDNSVKTFEWNR